jgi:ribonuclease R
VEGRDRLTQSVLLEMDAAGRVRRTEFQDGVIRSAARLSYEQAQRIADGDAALRERYAPLLPLLLAMDELARLMRRRRHERGSLDLDLPEPKLRLGPSGEMIGIVPYRRLDSMRVIEEFMLAANEAVATFLAGRGTPFLYRVHEPPDPEKLQAFAEFAAHFGYALKLLEGRVEPRRLQALLAEVEGKPEERMLNQVLLRSMKQARYTPENVGHFGLAAELYCHFTSPIRRYPDLVVHRVLSEVLRHGQLPERRRARLVQTLPAAGEQSSQRERRAMEAEREIVELKKCQFMADKVGESCAGIIAGVQPFGFFVELRDLFVEGLVHVTSLGDDFYQFDEQLHRLVGERQRRVFQIGGEVEVRVARVDLERRQIEFVLAEVVAPGRRPLRSPRRRER